MSMRHKLLVKYDALRDWMYYHYEQLFPTPVQVRLIEILGGSTITIGAFRRDNLPMTIMLTRGKLLRSKRFRAAILDGTGMLANDIKWAIKILGPEYERDVVAAYEMDERLHQDGWHMAYVSARDIWNNPARVRASLQRFLNA